MVGCVSSESLQNSSPMDRLAHNATVPNSTVYFLWVTTAFPFPRIQRPTTRPSSTNICHPSLHCLLTSFNNDFPEWGWTQFSFLSCGVSKIWSSRIISHWKVRVTSLPCVKLEATHPSNQCCGQGVHTVSLHDASLPRVKQLRSSLLALPIRMGKQCPWNWFIIFLWFANVLLPFAVLPPTRELRFLVMGGPPSYWPLPRVHRLPRGCRHLQHEAVTIGGTNSPDPSSNADDDRCCTCSTCTCGCHKKISSLQRLGPSTFTSTSTLAGYYYMPSQHSGDYMFSGKYSYNQIKKCYNLFSKVPKAC
jgi:hypothetical protein